METSRRGFLKLLGIGGVAVAVGGPSLFSASAHMGIGDMPIGRADHLVFDMSTRGPSGVLLVPDGTAHFLRKPDHTWMEQDHYHHDPDRLGAILLRNPKGTRHAHSYTDRFGKRVHVPARERPKWAPTGDPSVYQVNCPVPEGEDPHIAFFLAAAELQRKINDDVQEFSKHLRRRGLVMITQVSNPIMAFPHPDKGFYLETQLEQFAAAPGDIANRDQALSTAGEVPCETPNDITFKYLLHLQEELQAMGMHTWDQFKVDRKVAREAFHRMQGRLRA